MSRNQKYICGTPLEYCSGGSVLLPKYSVKAHNSPEEAFACFRRYLIREMRYIAVAGCNRSFRPPDGGPVLVLTKKARYGGILRTGKADTDRYKRDYKLR